MSMTRPTIARLMLIDSLIREKKYPSLQLLADHCEVHPRTVKRDLQVLREQFGAPLQYARERKGFYYDGDFSLAAPPITEGELLALCLMGTATESFRNTPFMPAIQRALNKLQLLLPEPAQLTLTEQADFLSTLNEPAPPERLESILHFRELLRASQQHRQVRITYYTLSRDAISTRVVDPYLLFFRRGMWYVHGWCHLRREERDFAVERIQQLETLGTSFPPPDLAAIRAALGQRFSIMHGEVQEVAIHFDAETSRMIRERIWHPSQRIDEKPDGSCTLLMQVGGLDSVMRWVLGFGRHAVPLAPSALVERVREEIRAMAARVGAHESRC